MNQTSILSWSITTVLLALSISLLRNKRQQPPLDFDNFVVLASSTGGFFIGMKVVFQALLDARVMQISGMGRRNRPLHWRLIHLLPSH
jgi:hypothetical protein